MSDSLEQRAKKAEQSYYHACFDKEADDELAKHFAAFGRAERAAALEEAAKAVEPTWGPAAAAAIRKLKDHG